MKKTSIHLAAALALAAGTAGFLGGCSSESTSPTAATPTVTTDGGKVTLPVLIDGVSDKECSHTITEDTPAFSTMPGAQGVPPIGTIKAGTKVLMMVPGSNYTKCAVAGGKTVYIKTSTLKPTTN